MKDYFHGLTTDEAKEERIHLTVWIGRVLLLLTVLVVTAWATQAQAVPIAQANQEGVQITLTDEDCKLPAVANLKKRATWTEKGRTYEGCYGGHPYFPIVMAYFSDKTVVALPLEIFTALRGA